MALPTDTSRRAVQAPTRHTLTGLTINGNAAAQRATVGTTFVTLDWPRSANGTSGRVALVLSGSAAWYWAQGNAAPANANAAVATAADTERAIAISGLPDDEYIFIAGVAGNSNITWYFVEA